MMSFEVSWARWVSKIEPSKILSQENAVYGSLICIIMWKNVSDWVFLSHFSWRRKATSQFCSKPKALMKVPCLCMMGVKFLKRAFFRSNSGAWKVPRYRIDKRCNQNWYWAVRCHVQIFSVFSTENAPKYTHFYQKSCA